MFTSLHRIEKYRYEHKAIISKLNSKDIELLVKLHPAIFSEIYQQRFVNSIYFDSFNMQNYFDNVDGFSERMKIRIRWYGNLFGTIEKPILEFKVKHGFLGKKESSPLKQFSIYENFNSAEIMDVIKKSDLPANFTSKAITSKPTILIRYCRKYYQSADGNYRITIDIS